MYLLVTFFDIYLSVLSLPLSPYVYIQNIKFKTYPNVVINLKRENIFKGFIILRDRSQIFLHNLGIPTFKKKKLLNYQSDIVFLKGHSFTESDILQAMVGFFFPPVFRV